MLGYQSGSIRMIPVDTAVSDSNRKYARSRKRHDHITFANSVLYQGDDWMKYDEEYGTWNWKPRNPREEERCFESHKKGVPCGGKGMYDVVSGMDDHY